MMRKCSISKKHFYIVSVLILPALLSFFVCTAQFLFGKGGWPFIIAFSGAFYPFYAPVAVIWAVLFNMTDSQTRVVLMVALPSVFAVVLAFWLHVMVFFFAMAVGYINVVFFFILLFIGKKIGLIISDDDVESSIP